MSLDWDISKVENYKEVCWVDASDGSKLLDPVTEVLVWATMEIDMAQITEKNWLEFWLRLSMKDGILGEGRIRDEDGSSRSVTQGEVRAHIGLRTNVSSKSAATWFAKVKKNQQHEWDCQQRQLRGGVEVA